MRMKSNKKGQVYSVGALGGLAIVLVVAAIIISIGAQVLDGVQSNVRDGATNGPTLVCGINGSSAFNSTCGGLSGTEIFGDWLDTIALIIVAAVVIGIIASSFGRQK